MSLSNTTSLTNLVKTYYDRILLEALDPKLVFYQFGIKKPLPTGEGTSILWNRPRRLDLGYVLSQGAPVQLSAGFALSTQKVSAIIRQFGGYTDVSDLVDLTAIVDVMKLAAQRLGVQAGETIERVVTAEICTQYTPVATALSTHNFYKSSSTNLTEYWGSASAAAGC